MESDETASARIVAERDDDGDDTGFENGRRGVGANMRGGGDKVYFSNKPKNKGNAAHKTNMSK